MKRVALIGHRGVGKSSLLKRIEFYYHNQGKSVLCLDLDREIEKRMGQPIRQIFELAGEAAFRDYEKKTFAEIEKKLAEENTSEMGDVFLALGAGFTSASIPEIWKTLWIRRTTDADGRIFLDRPRLNSCVSALEEYREHYELRQKAFRNRADETLWLDEGLDEAEAVERKFFLDEFKDLQGAVTVLPEQLRTPDSFQNWLISRKRWGVRWFELRDDLLSEAQIDFALQSIPKENVLISARDLKRLTPTAALIGGQNLAFDWPLELGPCSFAQPRFQSLHERHEGQSITDALARFSKLKTPGSVCKAALPTNGFKELLEGHDWQQADSQNRVFLPMSKDGRWSWYRLLEGRRADLGFFREGDGTSPDQPTLLQWARVQNLRLSPGGVEAMKFAAVLGDPVSHSRTPIEHSAFFAEHDASVFAIRVSPEDWKDGALETLHMLGLRWAAVTSPLKELAFDSCTDRISPCEILGAVNTLDRRQSEWRGTNTDLEGFRLAVEEAEKSGPLGSTAVWGGGGTLSVIGLTLPSSEFFSLRTQENRNPKGVRSAEFNPDTVIWAGGGRVDSEQLPPSSWKPKQVLDLNYKDDSAGRAYAQQTGCRYISGLAMFRQQAEAQRVFWKKGMS